MHLFIMDTYYTIDEKYLQAVEEYQYGESPKSLQLLNEIITADPLYARAYFQLGLIYYYELKDYQQAGYEHYLHLLAFLNMEKNLHTLKAKALQTPGVDYATIWNMLGEYAEKGKDLNLARKCYEEAFAVVTINKEMDDIEESIKRVAIKQQRTARYFYSIS